MADEDFGKLINFIKGTYQICKFEAASAKDYESDEAEVYRELHAKFVAKGFSKIPRGMTALDSGQPWFIYWLTQALEVMNVEGFELSADVKSLCVKSISRC
jgi:prenyltransferase beta subunit